MPHTLVPSDRVEHANVYGRDGAKLGTIERLMLDKVQRNRRVCRDKNRRAARHPSPLSGAVGRTQV